MNAQAAKHAEERIDLLPSIDAGHNDSGSPSGAARERRAIIEYLERLAR